MNMNIFQWRSLKTRLTLFTLAIFVASIWSLSFYASRMLYKDMERLLGDQQVSTTSIVATVTSKELVDRLSALEMAADRFSPAMGGSTASLQKLLEDRTLTQSLFNGGTFITGMDGTAVADVPLSAGRTGVSFMDSDYIAGPLKEGKPTIGRPGMDRILHSPAFAVGVPIRDTRGRVVGALAGVTRLDSPNFLDKILENRYGRSGYYLLEESKGRSIITGTDKSRCLQPLPAPGISPLIDRHVQGYDETGITVNPLGVEVLASAKRVPATDWFIVAALPTSEAFAPIHDMLHRIQLATVFLTLLAGGLTWWILRHQLSALLTAANTLTTLSKTNQPPHPLPIANQDEIGELIGGFNRLLETSNQREALLRQILDTSSVAIFLVDIEGRITQANRRMAEMFRCSPEALEGMEYVALVHSSEREIGRQKMRALLASAVDSVDLDRLYWRCDSTEFWGHLTGRRFFDARGEKRGLVGVIADVTERRQAEEALAASELRFRELLENVHLIAVFLDVNGKVTFCNEYLLDLAGYTREELIGSDWFDLLIPNAHPEVKELFLRGLMSGEISPYVENPITTRDGQLRDIVWDNTMLRDASGAIIGTASLGKDITESKLAELELQKKNAEIEQFIYTVSHDLRSPLVTIKTFMGYLESDMTGGDRERVAQDIRFIHGAADKMRLLLDELLEMSRIDHVETPPVRVALRMVLTEVLDALAGIINEQNVEIRLPDSELMLSGDLPRLCRIWQNLIENAIKYSGKGSNTHIELGTLQMSEETVFFVKDNGIGIDPRYHSKIFGIFDKLDPKSPGAGLGLSMVQRIVQKYGGRIWVESEGGGSGNGACFYFTLPQATGRDDSSA